MSTAPTPASPYTVGGSLDRHAPSYVVRQADDEFYQALRAGEFCYVFNSRQMGKSSLRVQTMQRLQADGVMCAVIDITAIGSHAIDPKEWYLGIVRRLTRSFRTSVQALRWWQEREGLPPVQRLSEFLEEVLLAEVAQPMVIFIDEIDSILKLEFKDDFFALIRACYNQRAEKPAFHRLTFALLGVTTPSDLIQDKNRTPFNIGKAIDLQGFQLHEVQPLVQGLVSKADHPQSVLAAILAWTGGQPFLTQKLCQLILEPPVVIAAGREAEQVEQVVRSRLIDNWEAQDQPEHLKTIRDRLLQSDEQQRRRVLGLCQQILQQGDVAATDSPDQTHLRLTGLVVKRSGKLQIYNRIYAAVFDLDWMNAALASLRPYGEALNLWLASNRQDESRLLRGQTLHDARAWAADKSLSDQDYQFLDASRELDQRDMQQRLNAEAEAKQVLAKANRKANRRIKTGATILVGALVAALASGGFAVWANQNAKTANQQAEKADRDRIAARAETARLRADADASVKAAEARQRVAEMQYRQAVQQVSNAQQQRDRAEIAVKQARQQQQQAVQQQQQAQDKLQEAQVAYQDAQTNLQNAERNREQAQQQTHLAQDGTRLERAGVAALGRLDYDPIGALVAVMTAGQELKQLISDNRLTQLKDHPAMSPTLALRTVLDTIHERNRLEGHQNIVRSASFSPDGEHIVTASNDGTARLWDITGQAVATLQGHQFGVTSASFSPDGQHIVTASVDGTARVWDLVGRTVATLSGHQLSVTNASFSADGQRIVTASVDGTARVWDLAGRTVATLSGHQSSVTSASFSADGQRIVTASDDKTVRVWNLTGHALAVLEGHQSYVTSASFSPDGARIVTAGDVTARVWDLTGRTLATLEGHQSIVTSASFSPDGAHVVTASFDGTARVWDLTGRAVATLQGHQFGVTSASFSADGQHIVTASVDNTARLWDLTGRELATLQGHQDEVTSASFSPSGTQIVTTSSDNTARLWDLTGRAVVTLSGHQDAVSSASFSPGGQRIVTASWDNTARVWDSTGRAVTTLEGHQDRVNSASFSPDGEHIVTASNDGTARVWDLIGRAVATLENVIDAGFSPDGAHIVTASRNGTARVWDLTGRAVATLEGHQGYVNSVSFSPNGEQIVTDYADNTARVWDLTRRAVTTLEGHQDRVNSASFSPDGEHIVTASFDNTARVWDLTGRAVATLEGHQDRVNSASFSPDGEHIVRYPQRSWWLDECDRPKGGCPRREYLGYPLELSPFISNLLFSNIVTHSF